MTEQGPRPTITSFHRSALKSFYKAFFVGTPLGIALWNIKMSKAVPDGLKPQECERGSGWVKPPIP